MKKYLKLCNISPQGYTGIAYYDHCFCQALHEIGVETHFVTSQKWLVDPAKAAYPLQMFFVDTYGDISRVKKGLAYVRGNWQTFLYVLRNKIPVVHFQLLELPIVDVWFFILFRIFGVKIVYTPHDIHSFKYQTSLLLTRILFALSDRLTVHNHANHELLCAEFKVPGKKIRQIQQGNYNAFLNPGLSKAQARERTGLPQDKKIILFFGNIRSGKGADTAVRAFKLIENKTGLLFVMAGKPMRNYDMTVIRSLMSDPDMKDHALLQDYFIADDLVESYYKAADVILIPYERIYVSAVICYSFSCGAATVVSDRPEFKEFALHGENCLIFESGNAADMAAKTIQLLSSEELRSAISRRAKQKADVDWDWRKTAAQLRDIYQELL